MSAEAAIPGWYGKLPSLGDFASRRLDPALLEAWDDWLAQGLGALRSAQGEAWLAPYLASPAWRFLVMPRVLPGHDAALAGVLMPSVDRVGRYFPLTLCAALAGVPHSARSLDALLAWLHELEDVAADALHDDWDIERLEQALAGLPCPAEPGPVAVPSAAAALLQRLRSGASDAGLVFAPGSRSALVDSLSGSIAQAGIADADGLSFWFAGAEDPPRLLVTRGLPQGASFNTLFGHADAASHAIADES